MKELKEDIERIDKIISIFKNIECGDYNIRSDAYWLIKKYGIEDAIEISSYAVSRLEIKTPSELLQRLKEVKNMYNKEMEKKLEEAEENLEEIKENFIKF